MMNDNTSIRGQFRVTIKSPLELDPDLVRQWDELEPNSMEPNPFLSPRFIINAFRYLSPQVELHIVMVEFIEHGRAQLTGIGVFEGRGPSWKLPLRHLSAYRCRHSPMSGLVIAKNRAEETLRELIDFLRDRDARWQGIELTDINSEGPLCSLLKKLSSSSGYKWHEYDRNERPTLVPPKSADEYIRNHPTLQYKDLKRRMRRLEELGKIDWHLSIADTKNYEMLTARFLYLEDMGWKQTLGTSLLCGPGDEIFFKQMTEEFSRSSRIFFCELTINGEAISSTANLISSDIGFAFKIGWNPEYAKMSPGTLNELNTVLHLSRQLPQIRYLDSCSSSTSYIGKLWSGSQSNCSGILALSPLCHWMLSLIASARVIKATLKQYYRPPTTPF